MSFVRPDARAALWRWREVLAGLVAGGIGLWWILAGSGILVWIGAAILAAGAGLAIIGTQRLRFRTGQRGPGAVRVDEGQIAYFGPLTGGIAAISELAELRLDPRGTPHWVLVQPGQPDLHIPLGADGAEALFDAFASLPGLSTEQMLTAMRRKEDRPFVVWRRGARALARHRTS